MVYFPPLFSIPSSFLPTTRAVTFFRTRHFSVWLALPVFPRFPLAFSFWHRLRFWKQGRNIPWTLLSIKAQTEQPHHSGRFPLLAFSSRGVPTNGGGLAPPPFFSSDSFVYPLFFRDSSNVVPRFFPLFFRSGWKH